MAVGDSTIDRTDRSARVWAVALTVALVVATMVWSCVLGPAVHHLRSWWIPGDAWVPLPAAHFIVWGAFPAQYSAGQGFVYLPGLPILLAPVAALGDHFLLSETIRGVVHVQKPSMWLLFGPYGAALAVIPIKAMRSLWTSLGVVRGRTVAQVALVVIALGPVVVTWGHFEEVAMLGFVLIATRLSLDDRHFGAALALAAAILCKQSALLLAPVLLFRVPRPMLTRAIFYALGPAVALTGLCLALNWTDASKALLFAQSFPGLGRAALWAGGLGSLVSTPFRVAGLALAGLVGWRVRGSGDYLVLAGLAVASVLRLATEPVLFAYYMAVPIVLVVTADLVGDRPWRRDLVAGAAASALFMLPGAPPILWWALFAAAVLVMVRAPLRAVIGDALTDRPSPSSPCPSYPAFRSRPRERPRILRTVFLPASSALSIAPAAAPATMLPGGVSGARGWGWVGAIFFACAMACVSSSSYLRLVA